MKRSDYWSEFEKAIVNEEALYRHAVAIEKTRNPYWPVLAKKIFDELHTWIITDVCSRRLQFDPDRIMVIKQTRDFGFEYGIGFNATFIPMPKDEYTWETYELFLASLIDEARRERDDAKRRMELLHSYWLVRVLLRQCAWHGWVLRFHRCRRSGTEH